MSYGEEQAPNPGGERNYYLQMGQLDLGHTCDPKDKYCQVNFNSQLSTHLPPWTLLPHLFGPVYIQ